MPRNACTTCRLSKVKCTVQDGRRTTACNRCLAKNVSCSYVQNVPSPPERRWEAEQSLSQRSEPSDAERLTYDDAASPVYHLQHKTPVLDIGRGRPEDLLRELELTQSLLLLYFSNFNDVHFLFDEALFLRQFAIGEAPNLILYAVMALGIRFSYAPFRDTVSPSLRGEILYEHARKLLLEDFDRPSITNIQAYVLLATYNVTFGGSMKGYLYLGMATNMLRALRLQDYELEADPLRRERHRRLVCTMALMDRLLSFPLRLTPHFSAADVIPPLLADEELWMLNQRTTTTQVLPETAHANIEQEIMTLSGMLLAVCNLHRTTGLQAETQTELESLKRQHDCYAGDLAEPLRYSRANLDRHRQRQTLRKFAYMHLLYHHIGMLLTFSGLQDPQWDVVEGDALACHGHAYAIVDIIQYCWTEAGFDLHNLSMSQILTVTTVVHAHALLTTSSAATAERLREQVGIMRSCILRVQGHTRLFNWVLQHVETFWRICCQNSSSTADMFERNPLLFGKMLQMGSMYENMNHRTGGRIHESLASPGSVLSPDAEIPDGSSRLGQWPRESTVDNFGNFAWMFSDSSLLELYAIPQN